MQFRIKEHLNQSLTITGLTVPMNAINVVSNTNGSTVEGKIENRYRDSRKTRPVIVFWKR